MNKKSNDDVRKRILFLLSVMGVKPKSKKVQKEMLEAWDELKETIIGVMFSRPSKDWNLTADEWNEIRTQPVCRVFKRPCF